MEIKIQNTQGVCTDSTVIPAYVPTELMRISPKEVLSLTTNSNATSRLDVVCETEVSGRKSNKHEFKPFYVSWCLSCHIQQQKNCMRATVGFGHVTLVCGWNEILKPFLCREYTFTLKLVCSLARIVLRAR